MFSITHYLTLHGKLHKPLILIKPTLKMSPSSSSVRRCTCNFTYVNQSPRKQPPSISQISGSHSQHRSAAKISHNHSPPPIFPWWLGDTKKRLGSPLSRSRTPIAQPDGSPRGARSSYRRSTATSPSWRPPSVISRCHSPSSCCRASLLLSTLLPGAYQSHSTHLIHQRQSDLAGVCIRRLVRWT